jgi:DNA modification methylase
LHPLTAHRVIEGLSKPGNLVLDAFCGSGTVLVEACLLGRRAAGVDINPIAIELARFKVTESTNAERQAWIEAAERVADHAEERRIDRAGPTRLYRPHEREPYEPHMLFELDGLSAGIAREERSVQRVLRLILSSILTKVSKSPGDTSERRLQRRLASGFAIRTFRAKATEVVQQHAAYSAALPRLSLRGPRVTVVHGDARRLPRIEPRSVDLIVSSPPYPGVFDYLQHHETRLQWLGLDGADLARNEIGSRRQLSKLDPEEALYRWQGDLRATLRAMAKVLKPSGKAALVIADSALKLMPVYADDLMIELAPSAGLDVLAIGSQLRPHFHAPTLNAFKRRARREHLIVLGPLNPVVRRAPFHKSPPRQASDTRSRDQGPRKSSFGSAARQRPRRRD